MPEQTAGGIWRLSFKDHLRVAEYALVVRSSLPPILFLHKGCCGHDRKMGICDSQYCSVEINEWFPTEMDSQRLLDLLSIGRPKLCVLNKQEKVDAWLLSQSRY